MINACDMRLIQSHSAHTRLYTFSKLKGLALVYPIEWPIFGMSSVECLFDGTLST